MSSLYSRLRSHQGSEPCLCGHPEHAYANCHALNPYTRRQMWEMRVHMVRNINNRLRNDPELRKMILQLGYEYYRPYRPVIRRTPESKNPTHKLGNLPVELIERVVEWTYRITIDKLPSSHPLIHGEPTNEEKLRKPGPVPTVLNLHTRAQNPYYRKRWLERHRGNWGPFFHIMYVSKLFYEIAKRIRYREIHIQYHKQPGGFTPYSTDLLCKRLLSTQMLKEMTKDIQLSMILGDEENLVELMGALATLPKLKHLCVTLRGSERSEGFYSGVAGSSPYLLQFFGLQLDTLTFIWGWTDNEGALKTPHDPNADSTKAPVPSIAEHHMQQVRNRFMENSYRQSSWYIDEAASSTKGLTMGGKARTSHDWTAKKIEDGGFAQWEMDTFTFATGRTSRPLWNLEVSPYNHPQQLNEEEREANRPLRVWRKGFEPYGENANES